MIDADAFQIPLVETVDAFVDLDLVMPAEVVKLGHVSQLAHRAVGFGGISAEHATEADFLHYLLGKLADGQFLARADVDVAVADFAVALTVGILEIDVEQHVDARIEHLLAP